MKKLLLTLLLLCLLLPALAQEEPLYVPRLELPEDFILGMDVSSVLALEAAGVKFYDHEGIEKDLFVILKENGINYIRVRVWNNPFDDLGRGFGGGNNDLEAAKIIGKRAAEQGMKLLVNFHYSDFWADPAKQQTPRAWEGLKIKEKAQALYEYTAQCLKELQDAGADIGMVQLGNETNGKMSGERTWMNIFLLMQAGSKAVREFDPEVLIAVHFANPESAGNYLTYASKLDYYKLDYDIFASSYYPYWHGTLDNLKYILTEIETRYQKKTLVMETSYAYTEEDSDFSANTIGAGGHYEKPWPFTIQGQANAVADIARAVSEIGGLGLFYWEGAWITVGGDSWEENSKRWEEHGAGWASSYATVYDPVDAGKYYGGSACDNQALFDQNGHALPSLAVFNLLRTGQSAPLVPDAVADTHVVYDLNGEVTLPEAVSVVMNDNSKQQVAVTWQAIDTAALKAGGVRQYVYTGEAQGKTARLFISMEEYNYLKNPGFEEEDTSMWVAKDLGATAQMHVEEKKSDAKSGIRHWHFYSEKENTVNFTLEQQVGDLPAGTYRFELSIQGGDGGLTDVYAYIKVNGELKYTKPAGITVYNAWDTPVIEGILVSDGDVLTAGIAVKAQGPGAWGKIDEFKLNKSAD